MMLLINFTGVQVRTQLELELQGFELALTFHLVETTWHSVCEHVILFFIYTLFTPSNF
jgi:hypothetical protein